MRKHHDVAFTTKTIACTPAVVPGLWHVAAQRLCSSNKTFRSLVEA
jgi:hypothetical protein